MNTEKMTAREKVRYLKDNGVLIIFINPEICIGYSALDSSGLLPKPDLELMTSSTDEQTEKVIDQCIEEFKEWKLQESNREISLVESLYNEFGGQI